MKKLIASFVFAVVAVACGSSESDSPAPVEPAGTTSSEGATGVADPLVGEWTQTFTCEDNVAAVDPNLKQYEEWIESNADVWDVTETATLDEPCAGSSEERSRIARIEDGHIVFFDSADNFEPGLDAAYELHGDRISANDGGQNFEGTYVFEFEVNGDELTFTLVGRGAKDPWFVSAWEAAPFVRTG